MKKIYTTLILIGSISVAHAGLNGLTAHSRANCLGFNESISWDATRNWDLRVEAVHYEYCYPSKNAIRANLAKSHELKTAPSYVTTWREAQLDFGETNVPTLCKWSIEADHYRIENRKLVVFEKTYADDCSVYDGWWDRDHPERKSINK